MGMGTLSRNTTFGVSGDLLSEIGTRSWQKARLPGAPRLVAVQKERTRGLTPAFFLFGLGQKGHDLRSGVVILSAD